jgi:cysteinyl-tRNA synthetase
MYVCGVTVYDSCHLGHARTYVVWDTVRRYLQWRGYHVTYVQNFTDVDDKILKRAQQTGQSPSQLAEHYIAAYFEDMDRLNILPADHYPRATLSMPAIVQFIQSLELKQFAYRVTEGPTDVYYAVHHFADYGQLSGRKFEDMQAGASGRVGEEEANKRDPFDFALWKSAPETEPGFPSPWGWGRPGWHIECSAMVRETLGNPIDIHAGGADLIFPHHDNEIAQSEPIVGKPMAKYWMHNGFLNINGEKMSKSLGNFTTLRAALEMYDPMVLRLFFLQTQYRSPIDLSDESLAATTNGWSTLKLGIEAAGEFTVKSEGSDPDGLADPDALHAFQEAMDDDFGTPGGLAVAFDLAKDLTRERNVLKHQGFTNRSRAELHQKGRALLEISQVLGLQPLITDVEASPSEPSLTDEAITQWMEQRRIARQSRQFQESDRIRDLLKAQGITVIDQADGSSRWIRG